MKNLLRKRVSCLLAAAMVAGMGGGIGSFQALAAEESAAPEFRFVKGMVQEADTGAGEFVLLNKSTPYDTRNYAVAIDLGEGNAAKDETLAEDTFTVTASYTDTSGAAVDPVDRAVKKIYSNDAPETTDSPTPGRYIVLELDWGLYGNGGDALTSASNAYQPAYTVTQNKDFETETGTWQASGGQEYSQKASITPVIDEFQYGSYNGMDYRYYLGEDEAGNSEELPLVIFFHGGGQGSDNQCHLLFGNGATVWAYEENQAEHPCHVLAPACGASFGWTENNLRNTYEIAMQMVEAGLVDISRIYVTGYSMGGGGTWNFFGLYPEVPAAVMPICAAQWDLDWDESVWEYAAEVPLWSLVTLGGKTVQNVGGEEFVAPIDELCGELCVSLDESYGSRFTNYKFTGLDCNWATDEASGETFYWDGGHCAWIPVYNEFTGENPAGEVTSVSDWMFAQQREGRTAGYTLLNQTTPYDTRNYGVAIDMRTTVSGSSIDGETFTVTADFYEADGSETAAGLSRRVLHAYVNDRPEVLEDRTQAPSEGRFVILELDWGLFAEEANDLMTSFDVRYHITQNKEIQAEIGTIQAGELPYRQSDSVTPVADDFQWGQLTDEAEKVLLDYRYYIGTDGAGSFESLPLVIFLHGGGQGYDNNYHIQFGNGATVWAYEENQAEHPCHVLAPSTAESWTEDKLEAIYQVVQQMITDGYVDPNRIYITGYSMGGMGLCDFINKYPDLCAAVLTICGTNPLDEAKLETLSSIPVWSLVTEGDFTQEGVEEHYKTYGDSFEKYTLTVLEENALDAYDPSAEEYKIFVWESAHCCWIPVYNGYIAVNPDGKESTVQEWLFAQSK